MRRLLQIVTGRVFSFGMSTESTNFSTFNRDVPQDSQTETNSNPGEDFDVMNAVSLFNSRLDAAVEKQKTLILSKVHDKLKHTNTLEFREGNKILRIPDKHG